MLVMFTWCYWRSLAGRTPTPRHCHPCHYSAAWPWRGAGRCPGPPCPVTDNLSSSKHYRGCSDLYNCPAGHQLVPGPLELKLPRPEQALPQVLEPHAELEGQQLSHGSALINASHWHGWYRTQSVGCNRHCITEILPNKPTSFLNCITITNWHTRIPIRMYFFINCITKLGSLDRNKLDLYLGDHCALGAPLVVVRPVALGEIHILEHSSRLPTLTVLVLFPTRHLRMFLSLSIVMPRYRLTLHPFLGEKSTGSKPLQSKTAIDLYWLLSWMLYFAIDSGKISIEFSLPHS